MPKLKPPRNIQWRASSEDQEILDRLMAAHGLNATSVIRMALRQLAGSEVTRQAEPPAVRLERYKNSGKITAKKGAK